MHIQKGLASARDWVRLTSHDPGKKRALPECNHDIFNETRVARAVVQANLVAVSTKALLVALCLPPFSYADQLEVFAQLGRQTGDLRFGEGPLSKNCGGIGILGSGFTFR